MRRILVAWTSRLGVASAFALSPLSASAEQFTWTPHCDIIWQGCCDLSETTKINNWQRTSLSPVCPVQPGGADDVEIEGDCVVGPSPLASVTAGVLNQAGGTFELNHALGIGQEAHFDGPFIWNMGEIGRAGAAGAQYAEVNAGLMIQGDTDKTLSFFGGFRLINRSEATWSGAGNLTVGMIPGGCCPAILENAAGATFSVLNNASIISTAFGVGSFENAGTLIKDSTGTSEWAVNLSNTGLVHVQGGELKLTRAGLIAGDWLIEPGAQLSFAGNFFELDPNVVIQGRAVVMQSGSNVGVAVNDDVTIDDLTIAADGRLGGTGLLRIAGTLTNEGGAPSTHIQILPGGRLESTGAAPYFGALDVEGEAHLPAGASLGCFGQILTVLPGGVFTIDDGATLGQTGLLTQPINNHGEIRKPPTSGIATIFSAFNWILNNYADGVISVEGGTIENYNRLESYGTIDITAGATFKQRMWANYYAGTTITGEGWFDLLAPNNYIADGFELVIPRLRNTGSVGAGQGLSGNGTLRITRRLESAGGLIANSTVTLEQDALFEVVGPDFAQFYGEIENYGQAEIIAGGMNYGVFHNHAEATLNLRNDTYFSGRFGSSPLINEGEVYKLSGAGDVLTGPLTNSGLVEIHSGRLTPVNFTQTAGETRLFNTGLACSTFALDGGVLTGNGTITMSGPPFSNNGGVIEPGASPGTLSIAGNYTQGAGGKLRIELGGLTPGSQHDQLIVSGAATLNGTLELAPFGAFTPQVGQQFTILTRGSGSGSFSSVIGLGGGSYGVTYNPTSVIVTVVTPPCIGDLNGSGVVEIGDLAIVLSGYGRPNSTYETGDLDFDGDVDISDLAIILSHYSKTCQ